jgi:hypothetical protein
MLECSPCAQRLRRVNTPNSLTESDKIISPDCTQRMTFCTGAAAVRRLSPCASDSLSPRESKPLSRRGPEIQKNRFGGFAPFPKPSGCAMLAGIDIAAPLPEPGEPGPADSAMGPQGPWSRGIEHGYGTYGYGQQRTGLPQSRRGFPGTGQRRGRIERGRGRRTAEKIRTQRPGGAGSQSPG